MGLRILACLFHLPIAVIYGSLSLFISILHNVFLLYYVDTFVSIYKIDKLSFWIGETVFLIWNSLNDPLFGWLSDRAFLSTQQSGVEISTPEVVLKRLKALSQNGPLFALSFLAFWIAWAHPGLQFLICLCLYDSFLTMVDLNQNALLADLAVSAKDRTGLNFYSSLFSAIGSLSVFMSYAVWNKEDFFSFRIFCVALAFGSAVGFTLATWLLRQRFQTERRVKWDENAALKELYIDQPSVHQEKRITLAEYLKQLSRHRNFLWFVSMNLIQVFHCHFNSNFFPLFLEHLLSDHISLPMGSFLLGVSYVAPHLNNLYFLSLCQRWGVYAVVQGLFFLKLLLSVLMLLAGPDSVHLLCFFIASNRVFTEGTCKLLNLVVTDLVDEDLVLNRRQQAASALLFGMVALVTKPGQTFAPLIGTWLLCAYTGYDIFQRDPLSNTVSAQPKLASNVAWEPTLRQGCFYLLVFVPIICAILQLLSWSQFTLHGRHLHMADILQKVQRRSDPDHSVRLLQYHISCLRAAEIARLHLKEIGGGWVALGFVVRADDQNFFEVAWERGEALSLVRRGTQTGDRAPSREGEDTSQGVSASPAGNAERRGKLQAPGASAVASWAPPRSKDPTAGQRLLRTLPVHKQPNRQQQLPIAGSDRPGESGMTQG